MSAAPSERPDRMLVAAKWWATQGVPVFPLYWPVQQGDRYVCACGDPCTKGSPAKHPLTKNGLDDASLDQAVIEAWWTRWPQANIGLRTGIAFDLFDVDGPAGFASLQQVMEKLGGEPQAVAVCVSGRIDGGRHYYMQPAGKKALAGGKSSPTGLDVKGNGGYAVGPPSRHISGTEYRWANGLQYGNVTGTVPWDDVYAELVATAPKKTRKQQKPEVPPRFMQPAEVGGDRIVNFGKAVLRSITDEMDAAVSGHRWDTFATECAMKLARAIDGGSVNREEGIDALQYAARRSGLDDEEVDRLPDLIDDAIAKGITDPISPKAEDGGESVRAYTPEQIDSEGWEKPTPLNRPVPAFPTYALGWLEDDVVRLARDLQTPVDLVAMLTLATLAATVRGRAYVTVRGTWTEPLNLYVLVLAGAGETKSPALAAITKPLRALEKELADAAAPEVARKRQAIRLQEGRLKKAEQIAISASPEDRPVREEEARTEREALENLPDAVAPRLLAGDTTAEGLVRLLAEQRGVMASLTAEGGLFDTLAGGRYSNGMANLDAVLQAHDGREPILVDRKVGDPIRVDNPCLTLGLAVQPQVLEKAGESDAAVGRGFLARFLFSYPESQVGRRDVDHEPSNEGFVDVERAVRGINDLLGQGFVDFVDVPLRNELRLTTTTLSYLNAFRAELEPRRGPSGDLASLTAWASKLDGQVVRLAGLLQLLSMANTSTKSTKPWPLSVEPDAMASATAVGEYLIEHSIAAHRLMSGRHFSATHPAQQLLGWIRDKGLAEFTVHDAHVSLRGRTDFHEAEAVAAAAEVLARHDYIRLLAPEKRPGRPSVRYVVNPLEP